VYQTVATSRLYEQIVNQIEQSIITGQLKPGDQLPPERELAQTFGVSRTAVREAVKALREKGLVEAHPGRGTFITDGTSQAIRQSLDRMVKIGQAGGPARLIEIRQILEPEIAARAALRASDKDVAALREAFAAMEAAGDDADRYIEADLDFHLVLAETVDNPIVLALIDSIVVLLREHRVHMFHVHGGPERGQFHHRRILEAVERHDADAARRAMQAHLQQVTEDTEKFSDAPASEPAS
jgi:GntR family transcriptional repressor for pyruvate dehydrogenase complex